MTRRLTRVTTRRQRPTGACGMDRLVARLAFLKGEQVTTDPCDQKATRKIALGATPVPVCLWHSLVAVEQHGARLVEYPALATT